MSFIQIDKKATTEAEGQALIEQTYGLTHPLGTATLFVKSGDFPEHWLEGMPSILRKPLSGFSKNTAIRDQLSEQIRQFYEDGHLDHLSPEARDEAIRELYSDVEKMADLVLKSRLTPSTIKYLGAFPHQDDFNHPHATLVETYKPPIRSAILLPLAQIDSETLHQMILRPDEEEPQPQRPGMDSQYHFMGIWHEIGHGTGAGEPQTEAIAAIATRKAFTDNTAMKAFADLRAFHGITRHDKIDDEIPIIVPQREIYGWPMVEVNDYIAHLPQETIDAMTEEDMINIRHQAFAHLGHNVHMIATMLREENEVAWVTGDLRELGSAASEVQKSPFLQGAEKQMLARFQLACERLQHGAPAYEEGNDLIDEDLLESERQTPVTFKPGEYIPE